MKPIEGVGTSTACFIGAAARGRPFYPTFITSWSEYERLFGGLQKGVDMPLAVYHFFLNGGKRAYIVRLLDPAAPTGRARVPLVGGGEVIVSAAGSGVWSESMSVEVRLSRAGANPFLPGQDPKAQVLYDFVVIDEVDGEEFELEVLPRLGVKEDGERFYASLINRDSLFIKVELPEGAKDFPEKQFAVEQVGQEQVWRVRAGIDGGLDGAADQVFLKSTFDRAFATLDVLDEINMLVVPGVFEPSLVGAGLDYVARRRDLIYIVDCAGDPRNRNSRQGQLDAVKKQLADMTPKDSHAALYFPWIEVADPYSRISGATRFAPPSGAIAGLYARTDNRRGVWKAPAGTEASILGAVGVAVEVGDNDQEALNPIGVNCIRQFPDAGIVCWGSRTIATRQDPEYRYVPVRRFAMFLAKSLYRGTQWVVFEPNDEPLWASIRFNLNAFMLRQFRAGALQGGKPDEAYFVKCDAENNPQASIDAGEVHITVGFAPLKPAEFVIIHLTQMRKE